MGSRRRFLKATGIASISAFATKTSARKGGDSSGSGDSDSSGGSSRNRLNPVECENVTPLGYHDLEGRPGFKMGVWETDGTWYLYIGHLFHSGWSVLDVTDPRNPTLENFIEGPPDTWTLQMLGIDGRLITYYEQPAVGWDPVDGPQLDETGESTSGIGVWDATGNPTQPERVGFFDIEGSGSHRNHYDGGDYVYGHAEFEGWNGAIFVMVDVSDPTNPTEAGRAWWPGQAPDEETTEEAEKADFHGPAYPDDGQNPTHAYLSYGDLGMVTADVSDPENPELVNRTNFGDVGDTPVANHTAILQPGTDIVWTSSEAIFEGLEQQWTYVFGVDKENPDSEHIISVFPTPTPPRRFPYDNYYEKGGRFGPHNQHHYQYNDDYYNPSKSDVIAYTWFNAGLRLVDVSDPWAPKEVGKYVPPDPDVRLSTQPQQSLVTQTEDVLIDSRGYVYLTHKNQGLHVVESALL